MYPLEWQITILQICYMTVWNTWLLLLFLSVYAYSEDKRGSIEAFAEMEHNYNYLPKITLAAR